MAEEATHQYKLCTVINSSKSNSCYNFVAMDSLVKAADSFQSTDNKEINRELFMEFMNKVTVWDYMAISREHYLALPDFEKQNIIREYYLVWSCLLGCLVS